MQNALLLAPERVDLGERRGAPCEAPPGAVRD